MFVKNPISNDSRVRGEAGMLVGAGHEVTVFGTWRKGLAFSETVDGISFRRLPLPGYFFQVRAALRAFFRFPKSRKEFLGVFRGIKMDILDRAWASLALRGAYDAFHAHDLDTLNIAWLCSRNTGSALVYDSHEFWLEWRENKVGGPGWQIARWRLIERSAAPAADLVVTVTDGIAAELKKLYDLDMMPLVLYNCAELRPLISSDILRRQYLETSPGRKIILYQGNISSGRGLPYFVELARRLENVDFVIVGPEPDPVFARGIREKAKGLGNLRILPPVPYEELWKLTAGADLGYVCTEPVCRSYDLGLSNKIFEYMVAGLPIVASRVAGHLELSGKIPGSESPFYFIDLADPAAGASVIRQALAEPGELARKAGNARRLAETRFNRKAEFSRLVEAYAGLERNAVKSPG